MPDKGIIPRGRTQLIACQGVTSGRSLVTPPGIGDAAFTNRQWMERLSWRLGITGAGQCCNNARSSGRRRVAECAVPEGHAVSCTFGPTKVAMHRVVTMEFAYGIEGAGAAVRLEPLLPEPKQSAAKLMDICACGIKGVSYSHIDVTVRSEKARAVHSRPAAPPSS